MSDFKIITAKLSEIDPNPMRRLKEYPYNEDKIAALRQSIHDVGLWAGVIGRKHGARVQIAFGHHRIHAARQELGKHAEVQVIVRPLSDQEMLEFMGRENLEDYNANFFVMLESWQAAKEFLAPGRAQIPKPLEIAKLLGWIRPDHSGSSLRMKKVAEACDNASSLIEGGYLTKSKLDGLPVHSVLEICQTVVAQQQALEAMAKRTGRPAAETEQAKKVLGRAGGYVADDIRKGVVAQRDIRGRVELEAYRFSKEAKKRTPLFEQFGQKLAQSIGDMLQKDSASEKLSEVRKALGADLMAEDVAIVKRIGFECEALSERAEKWAKTFANPTKKVTHLKEVK
jgi:ParB-like chromosome segregation protein Spo0J